MARISMNGTYKREIGIDILKAFCCFIVAWVHIGYSQSKFDILISPFKFIAVPCFFMITGFYYYRTLNKQNGIIKQIIKILYLFVIANAIYLFWNAIEVLISGQSAIDYLLHSFDRNDLIYLLLFNHTFTRGHLWYLGALLYTLVIVYLFDLINKKGILYFSSPILIILVAFFNMAISKDIPLNQTFLFTGIPYFCLGRFLKENEEKVKQFGSKKAFITIAIMFILFFVESRLFTLFNVQNIYNSISTTIMSLALFIFFKYYDFKENKLFKTISNIGKNNSLDIYIWHFLVHDVLKILTKYIGLDYTYNEFLRLAIFALTLLICILFSNVKNMVKRKKTV